MCRARGLVASLEVGVSYHSDRYRDDPVYREHHKEDARRFSRLPAERQKRRVRSFTKNRKAREFLHALKSVPCKDCGHTFDPVCMDFDHRPGEVKLFTIGNKASAYTPEKLLAEIAKCDVVCACCHRLRTFRQRAHRRGHERPVAPQLSLLVGVTPNNEADHAPQIAVSQSA